MWKSVYSLCLKNALMSFPNVYQLGMYLDNESVIVFKNKYSIRGVRATGKSLRAAQLLVKKTMFKNDSRQSSVFQ